MTQEKPQEPRTDEHKETEGGRPAANAAAVSGTKPDEKKAGPTVPRQQHVFVVQSGKENINNACLRFLHELGIKAIVLNDRRVQEIPVDQFVQRHIDIHFAAVLLSGDEFVYAKDTEKPSAARLHARRDTIFKMGYLLGKFGRNNVFILFQEQKSFILPTGQQHAIYTEFGRHEIWKKVLIRRLEAGGYPVSEKK